MEAPHRGGSAANSSAYTTSTTTTPMRSATPETLSGSLRNPFDEKEQTAPSPVPGRVNPFTSPFNSRPQSSYGSSTGVRILPQQKYFHSRRVRKGEVEQPWKSKSDPREKWVSIIPLIGLLLGCGIAGFLVYDGMRSVVHHQYCSVLNDDFSNGFNSAIWTKEVELGGFG